MKQEPLQILKSYANQREKAYQSKGCLDAYKLKAIARIKQLADYWKQLPTEKQRNIVKQCKAEVLALLPAPDSRFQKQREKILQLLAEARG